MPDTVPEGGVVPPPLDSAWAESTRKKALLKLEKLDTDLKNYKGNSIKESIRYEGRKLCMRFVSVIIINCTEKCICKSNRKTFLHYSSCWQPSHLESCCVSLIKKKSHLRVTCSVRSLASCFDPLSILPRRGHDDLGDHYLDCGDLSNALKCYSRARDYCTSAKHVINMCLNVIKVKQDDTTT